MAFQILTLLHSDAQVIGHSDGVCFLTTKRPDIHMDSVGQDNWSEIPKICFSIDD